MSKPVDPNVWESLSGKQTPIADMGNKHLICAIACIERNDPSYGPRQGVALQALYRERRRRGLDGVTWWRNPSGGAGCAVYRGNPAVLLDEPQAPEERGQKIGSDAAGFPVYGLKGDPSIQFVDDRAGRAHRRIDKLEETLRALGTEPTNQIKRRLAALEAGSKVTVLEALYGVFDRSCASVMHGSLVWRVLSVLRALTQKQLLDDGRAVVRSDKC